MTVLPRATVLLSLSLLCCGFWSTMLGSVPSRADFARLQILDDYIYSIVFDVWGLDPPDRDRLLESVVSRQSYAQYVEGRNAERYVHF